MYEIRTIKSRRTPVRIKKSQQLDGFDPITAIADAFSATVNAVSSYIGRKHEKKNIQAMALQQQEGARIADEQARVQFQRQLDLQQKKSDDLKKAIIYSSIGVGAIVILLAITRPSRR